MRPSAPSSAEEIKAKLEALQDGDGGDPSWVARQLWLFFEEMQPGDTVFAYGKDRVLGWGEILGEYVFEEDDFSFPHRREVRWHPIEPVSAADLSPDLRKKFWRPRTITPVTQEECAEVRSLMLGTDPGGHGPTDGPTTINALEAITRAVAARALRFTPWQIATFYTSLQTKGFVILSGISGTGKTKLAQCFAGMLPQPQPTPEPTEDQLVITLKPYMLKYNRFIIPKQAVKYFEFPPPGETQELDVQLEDQHQSCRLTHNATGSGTYLSLLLKGPVRERFAERFSVGDRFVLEPKLDEEQLLAGFRLASAAAQAPHKTAQTTRGQNALFLSVRPDWRDSKNLLGYFNPLTGTYQWTPFLRFLLKAAESYRRRDGLAWFVILDEMNLAHVEYYFADLLSVLESGRDAQGWTNEPLRLVDIEEASEELPPKELRLPPNLYVVGTVNADETTQAFSPKVLDRAFSLELSDVDFTNYPGMLEGGPTGLSEPERRALLAAFTHQGTFARVDKGIIAGYVSAHPESRELLKNLNQQLGRYAMHFGYRVFDEIVTFSAAAEQSGVFSELPGPNPALDTAVLLKVLPKFHGARSKLEGPLKAVLAWCQNPGSPNPASIEALTQKAETADALMAALSAVGYQFPYTAERVQRMLRDLHAEGFTAFG